MMNTMTSDLSGMSTSGLPGSGLPPKQAGKLTAVFAIFGALIYLISPLDLIPDLIPFVCHLDDVGVIAAAWKYARSAFGASVV